VVLAVWLEHKFSKQQILELYLNRVYFGAGAYGVEAAAQRYFGKSAKSVTLAEAALLAGLVKSPSRLSPTKNFDGAEKRAQLVLAAMADYSFADPGAVKVALAHPPRIVHPSAGGSVNYVADWVMDAVNELIGRFDQDIIVETTIDPALQAAAEKSLVDVLSQKSEKFDVEQGALVAMTPQGAVRALVGGKNYAESQFNRAIAAKRQPGSSFKPFVYSAALQNGFTPATIVNDSPPEGEYQTELERVWRPENFNNRYFGFVSLRFALQESLNAVSIRITKAMGVPTVARYARKFGFDDTAIPNNLSIALGAGGIAPLDLVTGYATFANGGYRVDHYVIQRIANAAGEVV
jgi:penicillin-binding protein 1A